MLCKNYFIDIGVPEEYSKPKMTLDTSDIFKDWTLFLDRDGVINKRIVDDYVKSWADFVFLRRSNRSVKIFQYSF